MKQIELGFYTREQIAEILSIRLKGNGNFKRDVEKKLSKWCYGYRYKDRQGVYILSQPQTPEDRLAEIFYRGIGISVQIDIKQLACFIAAFMDIEGFKSEPWETREPIYNAYYGFDVSERTLRNWCSQLIDCGMIVKDGDSTRWRTYYADGKKIQEPIEEIDEVEMQSYFERRTDLFKENRNSALERGFPPIEARNLAWKATYIALWKEFKCCYYYCKGFALTGFFNEKVSDTKIDAREVYALCRQVAGNPEPSFPEPSNEVFTF